MEKPWLSVTSAYGGVVLIAANRRASQRRYIRAGEEAR